MAQELDVSGINRMIDAHEDRIQRLESVTSELASSVAEQNATMKAFSLQMRMMSDSVCEKLDDVSTRLSDKIGSIADISKELNLEIRNQDKRIDQIEESKKVESKLKGGFTKELLVKIGVGIATAGLGFGGHVLVQFLKLHWQ